MINNQQQQQQQQQQQSIQYRPYTSSKQRLNHQTRHSISSSKLSLINNNLSPTDNHHNLINPRPSSYYESSPHQNHQPNRFNSASSSTSSASSSSHPSPIVRSPSSTSASSSSLFIPTPNKSNQVPFRAGFQARGVYRNRTEELIHIRNLKQESKRLEEARLQKRLEKLIDLHFPNPSSQLSESLSSQSDQDQLQEYSSSTSDSLPIINLSQKLFGIVRNVTVSGEGLVNLNNNSIRLKEQSIVRWQDDNQVKQCKYCQTPFGLRVRKHHCRLCGSVICFSPPWMTGQKERCSTMIRFEWGLQTRNEKSLDGQILQLTDQEMGIPDDRQSVLDLISAGTSKSENNPSPQPVKPRKGVRICCHCLAIILRRQAMTYPPQIPYYIHFYSLLKRLQDEIDRAIPEFQELMASSKHPTSNLNPSSSPPPSLKLLTIRRKLLTNLSSLDSTCKKLSTTLKTDKTLNQSEIRLITAITTRTGFFLRDHMSLIRSLGLLESDSSYQKTSKPASSNKLVNQRRSNAPSSHDPHDFQLALPADDKLNDQSQENENLIKLNVLLEQEHLIESYLSQAQAKRQLEDVASLKSSLDDLREEIANLKKTIMA